MIATVKRVGTLQTDLQVCAHCGAAVTHLARHQPRDEGTKVFCCTGCKTVYSILRDRDLLGFYEVADNSVVSLKEKPASDYSYCDSPWFRDMFVKASPNGAWSLSLKLPEIHCAACVWLLEKLPEMLPGLTGARINYLRKHLTVSATADITPAQAIQLVADLGYAPDFSRESAATQKLSAYDKSLLRRMAVAAFAFGNAMLFSLPEYFSNHVESAFAKTFIVLNAALATFVLFYSAGEFFKSAWRALKKKQVVIDLPISIGIAAMFVRSAVDIATGTSAGYFDTFAGLIFFLLIGRYVQSRSYAWLNFERDNLLFLPLAVRVQSNGGEIFTPVKELKPGDALRLLAGEIAPARCRVLSETAAADYAFITGESVPVSLVKGDMFEPGGKVVGQSVKLTVTEAVDQAQLNRIWENAPRENEDILSKPAGGFAERILPWFTFAVVAIATGALLYWLPRDPAIAFNAFSAVLVITCPCALAMAKPFSFFTAQSALARQGLFLKSAQTIEKFFNITSVVFDKTGTLTQPGAFDIRFDAVSADLSDPDRRAIATLAGESTHPLSRAVAKWLGEAFHEVPEDFTENPGLGVAAVIGNDRYLLGSAAWLAAEGVIVADLPSAEFSSVVWCARGKTCLGRFQVRNQLRENLSETVERLKGEYNLSLISGDSAVEHDRFAAIFGSGAHLSFHARPEEKARLIGELKKSGPVMMVGDGLNDAAALAAADLGVALTEDNSHFSPASDAVLSAAALPQLPGLMAQARQSRKTAITAYGVSFAYNAVGISVAVAGKLTPLFCAVLMPLSSLSVIALAFASAAITARLRGKN
ncbi:heavy metal translocating P-type ATPase [Turneriella parva]|uniref:E1-E2 ATPase-associated domain protein n=1 Tax=Turneriella parva (strain ATCC BAA-1111 / DSM 21527 / NCTC 11395 / H) TaxID=869212 RepID=I4BBN5_TURPD|nr:heavy metal translocating P-type ATPase metal-binding domain-containing protein [Turneriella parva]AFM14692.1 E1-E2 ATPase-associated domain protein [Turneriella parva DSM 21527]